MSEALKHPHLVSLAAGFTDNATLPVKLVEEIAGELLRSEKLGPAALQYGTTSGDPELRELTAAGLAHQDGLSADHKKSMTERMLLTNGSQQLLYLTVEALCDEGDIILVEDPTYFVFLGILQSRGIQARGVRMEPDGISLEHLEEVLESLKKEGLLPRVKMLYLVSYFQNPSGVTTAYAKKAAALRLLHKYEAAAGHKLYLLEDAAYRGLSFGGEDVKSSLAVGDPDRVIYAGTYSKPFATGIRVGFGILPEPVHTAAWRIKGNHDFGSSHFLQRILALAIANGGFEMHVQALRQRYARKASVMQGALSLRFPEDTHYTAPAGGLYFWAEMPPHIKTGPKSALFQAALKHDVLYVPGEFCFAADPTRPRPDYQMRLSFGAASREEILLGIERLGETIRTQLRLHPAGAATLATA